MSKPKFKDLVLEFCFEYGKDDDMLIWSFLNRLYFTNLAQQTLPFYDNRHKIYELMFALNGREKYKKGNIEEAELKKDIDFIIDSISNLMEENGIVEIISRDGIYDEIGFCMEELGLQDDEDE